MSTYRSLLAAPRLPAPVGGRDRQPGRHPGDAAGPAGRRRDGARRDRRCRWACSPRWRPPAFLLIGAARRRAGSTAGAASGCWWSTDLVRAVAARPPCRSPYLLDVLHPAASSSSSPRSPARRRSSSTSPTRATCRRWSTGTQLVDGNGKLEASRAVAQVAGPGGSPVCCWRVLGAPLLIAVDAVSFLLSALFLRPHPHARTPCPTGPPRRPLRTEIAEGLGFVAPAPGCCAGSSPAPAPSQPLRLDEHRPARALRRSRTSGCRRAPWGWSSPSAPVGGLLGAATGRRAFARRVGEGRAIPLSSVVFAAAGAARCRWPPSAPPWLAAGDRLVRV